MQSATDLLLSVSLCTEENKAKIHSIAVGASEQLYHLVLETQPLWLVDKRATTEVLNLAEYARRFAGVDFTLNEVIRLLGHKNDPSTLLQFESSRAVGFVAVDRLTIVNMMMDPECWSNAFCNIISKASCLGMLSTGGLDNPHGALQVVNVELHFPSPMVRTREACFARYCRQIDSSTWLVTDVSLESVFPNLNSKSFLRRPSGCLIEALNVGSSKVTWVENNVVSTDSLLTIFEPKLAQAFGANRWIATLERQYDRKYILQEPIDILLPSTSIKNDGLGAGKKCVLKLAERMMRSFNANISSYSENSWRPLPFTACTTHILYNTRFNCDQPGTPRGASLTIAASVRLQKHHKDLFNFLSNAQEREKWDVLSHGRKIREIEKISFGPDSMNMVSLLLSVSMSDNDSRSKNSELIYIQETMNDSMGMYVVYAPLDKAAMNYAMNGNDPDNVSILPCGFAVFPDYNIAGGSVLSLAFEIVNEYQSSPENELLPQVMCTACGIIETTIGLIKAAIFTI